jgi:Ca2+-binding EF-hand superfamily protein
MLCIFKEKRKEEKGDVNSFLICRLFEEIDEDGDDCISPSEVRKLLLDIKSTGMNINKDSASEELIKVLDLNDDKKITKEEFVHTFTKWLEETKYAMEKRYFTINSLKRIDQVFSACVK